MDLPRPESGVFPHLDMGRGEKMPPGLRGAAFRLVLIFI
jgi:hypothetical protein